MTDTLPDFAANWNHATTDIPARGLALDRTASPDELRALAVALEIQAVQRLTVRYRISPGTEGRFKLTGEIETRVVQACVVTLDPVATDIAETLDVEFWPTSDLGDTTEDEQEALAAQEYEPIEHQRIAVGRVAFETLAAALPAFPRTADAALDQHEAGPSEPGATHPFAALAGWKPKSD